MNSNKPEKTLISLSLGDDEPIELPDDNPICLISPRDTKESMISIIERAHDMILMNRERSKLNQKIEEIRIYKKFITELLPK